MSKSKTIATRVSEDQYKAIKKSGLNVSNILSALVGDLVGVHNCPCCGHVIKSKNNAGKK